MKLPHPLNFLNNLNLQHLPSTRGTNNKEVKIIIDKNMSPSAPEMSVKAYQTNGFINPLWYEKIQDQCSINLNNMKNKEVKTTFDKNMNPSAPDLPVKVQKLTGFVNPLSYDQIQNCSRTSALKELKAYKSTGFINPILGKSYPLSYGQIQDDECSGTSEISYKTSYTIV